MQIHLKILYSNFLFIHHEAEVGRAYMILHCKNCYTSWNLCSKVSKMWSILLRNTVKFTPCCQWINVSIPGSWNGTQCTVYPSINLNQHSITVTLTWFPMHLQNINYPSTNTINSTIWSAIASACITKCSLQTLSALGVLWNFLYADVPTRKILTVRSPFPPFITHQFCNKTPNF